MPWSRWTQRTLELLIWLLAAWLIAAAAYVSLGRLLVPAVADYQQQVVSWFEQASGRAISLQQLQGEMQGSQPVLKLQGLRVHANADPDSPVLFALDRVNARLDVFASLWQQRPVMDALQIEGLAFELLEDAAGVWRLQGLGESGNDPLALKDLADLLLSQRRITLLDSKIQISPHGIPAWAFSRGDLTLRNKAGETRLDAQVVLPDGEPAAARFQGRLQADNWAATEVQGYVSIADAEWVQRLPQAWLDYTGLGSLNLGLALWFTWADNSLQQLTAELDVDELVRGDARLSDGRLQLAYQQHPRYQQLAVQLTQADLQAQSQAPLLLSLERNRDSGNWRGALNHLALQPLAELAVQLLPEQRPRAILASLAPRGHVRDIHLSGDSNLMHWQRWQLMARLDQVALDAWQSVPGFRGINGVLQGTPAEGLLQLDTSEWSIALPDIFPAALGYHALQADVFWTWQQETGFTLDVPGAAIQGEEGPMAMQLHLDLPVNWRERAPHMRLQASLTDSQARFYSRYLPVEVPAFNPAIADWLQASAASGAVPHAVFSFDGGLLAGQQRAIDLYVALQDGSLLFQPDWPRLEQVDARLWLSDGRVMIEQGSASLWQSRLDEIVVHSRKPAQQTTHLDISARISGPLEDGLRLLQDSPLRDLTADPLAGWQASGQLQGELQLGIPLQAGVAADVDVSWQVSDSQLRLPGLDLPIAALSGDFSYQSASGLQADGLQARVLGAGVRGEINSAAGYPVIRLRGRHAVEQLQRWSLLSSLPAGLFAGDIDWQAGIELLAGEQRVTLSSRLQDLRILLPSPLNKSAGDEWPAELQLSLQPDRQRWRLRAGENWYGLVHRDGEQLAADIRYRQGRAVTPIWPGVSLSLALPSLDLDVWRDWYTTTGRDAMAADDYLSSSLIKRLSLQLDSVSAFGWQLDDLALSAAHNEDGWVIDVDQQDLRGLFSLPLDPALPRVVELQRLRLPVAETPPMNASALIEPVLPVDPLAGLDPRQLPAINVGIDQLYHGETPVGGVRFYLRPLETGLQLQGLEADLRGLQLNGELEWLAEPQQSRFRGQLATTDIGQVLTAWEYAPTLTSDSFSSQLDLQWPGSPAFFAFSRSSGELSLQAREGMLQSGDSGADALRVFGLLNFNALTRRLRLDFSDIFGSGTAYDELDGTLDISRGRLQTRTPLQLEGPSARLQLDGMLDLPSEQIDMGLLVTLPITNNLPLAALLAGAPQIAGVLFLADRILGDRVARFASVRYRLSGDWQQPKVEFDRAFDNQPALEE